ncbi:MAG TPA: RnfABCDGE type electron transport complex subunit G [Patescibacteria group bacterium]|nr:RnfABCDGE type electron transport complex subunit G [Patescibacteria group bacterium]
MGKSFKLIVILTIISLLSGGVLASAYSFTAPKMQEVALQNQQKSIFKVLPGIKSYREFENDKNMIIFEGIDDNGNVSGLAYIAEGSGFQGKISLMIGLDLNSKQINGYKVLEHQETPGLGANIDGETFKQQFSGKSWEDPFKVKDDIIAITGATISSKAITDLMKKSVTEVIKIYGGEK